MQYLNVDQINSIISSTYRIPIFRGTPHNAFSGTWYRRSSNSGFVRRRSKLPTQNNGADL